MVTNLAVKKTTGIRIEHTSGDIFSMYVYVVGSCGIPKTSS